MVIGTAAAIIGGSLIAGAGTALASSNSSKASAKATAAAQQSATQNNALQQQIYNSNAARLDPYANRGNAAGGAINALLGLGSGPQTYAPQQPQQQAPNMLGQGVQTGLEGFRGDFGSMLGQLIAQRNGQQMQAAPGAQPQQPQGNNLQQQNDAFANFRNSTGYQFRVNEGMNALQQQYAGRGLLQSGAAQAALQQRGQDYGSQEFGNYLGALQNQQNTGLAGASAVAGVGQNFANATSANNNSAASAAGNAALANGYNQNQAIGSAVGGFNQLLGSSFGGGGNAGGGSYTPSVDVGGARNQWGF